MARFKLEKWYFDCVTASGTVFIGYAAKLNAGPFRLGYGAVITKAADGPPTQRQSFFNGTVDDAAGNTLWTNDPLKVRGEWTAGSVIPPTILLDESAGRIEWQCLGANCAVDVRLDGQSMIGTGYVEKLSMTIPPWRLPFTELRWGRFISDDRSNYLVWIDMRGETPRNWVWFNSPRPVAGTVDGDGVRANDAELIFNGSAPLRSGNVAESIFGRFQFLKILLPRGARGIREDKRLCDCLLRTQGAESKGSAIYEVVIWGR